MSTILFSSDLLRRLRGPAVLGLSVVSLAAVPFDEDDVRPIDVGDSRSGSISTSDVDIEYEGFGLFYNDFYVFNSGNGGSITIEVDPASSFDVSLEIYDDDIVRLDYQDEGGEGDIEESVGDADEDTCYVILVSSSEPEETGSYTLRIED